MENEVADNKQDKTQYGIYNQTSRSSQDKESGNYGYD
jgi:hypothetical protein